MKKVIAEIVDDGDFFEVFPLWAMNIVCGFARIDGHVVGIVGNQPQVLAGCLDIDASEKAARFVRTCDAFNIPLVTFVDVPGFLPGTDQEYGGIIRHGAKLLYAYCEATVPRVQIITRKGYGGAYVVMNSKSIGADIAYAWPSAEIAVMGADGRGRTSSSAREIETAADPESRARPSSCTSTRSASSNPYQAAERGYVDDVIDPRDTRKMLVQALAMLRTKREQLPAAQARQLAAVIGARWPAPPSPEQVAAIVAAIAVVEAERARPRRRGREPRAPEHVGRGLAPRSAQRACMQRGPWRLSGRLGALAAARITAQLGCVAALPNPSSNSTGARFPARFSSQTPTSRRAHAPSTPNRSSVAGRAVDALAEEVGVAVVAGVLLDHVHEHPAQRDVRRRGGRGGRRRRASANDCSIVRGSRTRSCQYANASSTSASSTSSKSPSGFVVVVEARRRVLASQHPPEPVASRPRPCAARDRAATCSTAAPTHAGAGRRVEPSHFHASVARWYSSQGSSIVRSSATVGRVRVVRSSWPPILAVAWRRDPRRGAVHRRARRGRRHVPHRRRRERRRPRSASDRGHDERSVPLGPGHRPRARDRVPARGRRRRRHRRCSRTP